jgi:cytochrome c-type biogenesis protein CcmF
MIETGHFALILACALSVVQSAVPIYGAKRNDQRLMAIAGPAAVTAWALVAISFISLVSAYVTSDFSVLNVFENSYSRKPLLYQITGTWGNHEGSMLLWVLIVTFFGALVAVYGRNLPPRLRANVLGVQGTLGAAFMLYVLATSNPFERIFPAPVEGKGLNPVLQDIGLAIHPPLLYLGYVGFSICFSFAVAALIEGRIDATWARWVRPWTLTAWTFLTGGIAMGSFWAYYELGWGGFWFWDPVENASFMPWLAGTALLHSAVVMEKRAALKIWTILLAIVTFSFSLLGAFMVRSGVLTSVHAFASDPSRGLFILALLFIFIGGALTLFATRVSTLRSGGLFQPISREGALVLNNLFLTTAAATVLIGTLYPLFLEVVAGDKISVGAPFFNLTFGPIMVPLLFAVPFGPLLAWKRGDLFAVCQRLFVALGVALAAIAAVFLFVDGPPVLAALGIGLAFWLFMGSITDLALKSGVGSAPLSTALNRFIGLPRSVKGTALAHFGLGITLLGIVCVSAFQTERITVMKPGGTIDIAGYSLKYEGLIPEEGPNYEEQQGHFLLLDHQGSTVASVVSAKRIYAAKRMPTTEAGIKTIDFSQLYISLGDPTDDGGIVVRAWWKPYVTFIWLGALVMMFGGIVSLADRRLRIGAPSRRRRKEATA